MSRLSRIVRVRFKKSRLKKLRSTKWVAGIIFTAGGWYLTGVAPNTEIAWVIGFLIFTIYLFVFEIVNVDEAAVMIMVLLGVSSLLAPTMGLEKGLVDTAHLFDGFASNAVMSIIAVMIIGAGLDKTGVMSKVASFILRVGGSTEGRIIPIISGTVGVISSFMQNVGAAALFLPVVSRISARSGLPMSRLLMPMGFTAILGGTMTMVGSSPLILLNDLILTSNMSLPADQQMETWGMFSVTPIGVAMVITGIVYFVIAGRFVLPAASGESSTAAAGSSKSLQEVYGVDYMLFEVNVPADSPLVGQVLNDIETANKIRIIAVKSAGAGVRASRGDISRDVDIGPDSALGILCSPEHLRDFVGRYVPAQPGPAFPLQSPDNRLAVGCIFQIDPENLLAALDHVVGDEPLLLKDAGYLALKPRMRHFDHVPPRHVCIPDTGKHVRYGIRPTHIRYPRNYQLAFVTPGI